MELICIHSSFKFSYFIDNQIVLHVTSQKVLTVNFSGILK